MHFVSLSSNCNLFNDYKITKSCEMIGYYLEAKHWTTLKLFQLTLPTYGVEHSCGLFFTGRYNNLFLPKR